MSDVAGLGRMDFFVGLTFEQFTSILFWFGGGVYLVWKFYSGVVAPAYIEDKRDVREFKQQTELTASGLVHEIERDLVDDVLRTKNQQIAEIRLAVEASTEEILVRIKELENRLTYLQGVNQRQDAAFTILNMNLSGLIDEQNKAIANQKSGDKTVSLSPSPKSSNS